MAPERTTLAKLIAQVIERMPRADPEAIALRIIGTLDQAGYEIRQRAAGPQIIGFES